MTCSFFTFFFSDDREHQGYWSFSKTKLKENEALFAVALLWMKVFFFNFHVPVFLIITHKMNHPVENPPVIHRKILTQTSLCGGTFSGYLNIYILKVTAEG